MCIAMGFPKHEGRKKSHCKRMRRHYFSGENPQVTMISKNPEIKILSIVKSSSFSSCIFFY